MAKTLLGKKIGMTRLYTDKGVNVPVTVIEAGPCYVSQVKSEGKDGYSAVQMAFIDIKPRRSTFQKIGHDAKAGISPKRIHREFRVEADDIENYELGQELNVELFEDVKFVDVIGISKGKGFQGQMKRWNFKGLEASHGVKRRHRSGGSIAGHASNPGKSGGIKKGKKMPGHMGSERVTVRSIDVIGVDKEKNLLLVKGPVPGAKQGVLVIREAKRLFKSKARIAQAS